MFSYRDQKEILDAAYDLDDLEQTLKKSFTARRVGDIASKLHKLINEHTFSSACSKARMLGVPYIDTNTIEVVDMKLQRYHPDLFILQEQFVSLAPAYGEKGAVTIFDFGCSNFLRMQLPGPVAGATEQRFKVTKFAESAGMYAKGRYVKRETAIDFVRNKRGGAHAIEWNLSQRNQKKLHDILAEVYDPSSFNNGRYQGLVQMTNHGMNHVEMYIWNIATDLVYAKDTRTFLGKMKEAFPLEAP